MKKRKNQSQSRRIPMTGELKQALERQRELFRQKFGRDPDPEDPVFFDPEAPEPRPLRPGYFHEQLVQIMELAGIDPRKIYAVQQTGRIVTSENQHLLSAEDLAEWQAALAEYDELWGLRN